MHYYQEKKKETYFRTPKKTHTWSIPSSENKQTNQNSRKLKPTQFKKPNPKRLKIGNWWRTYTAAVITEGVWRVVNVLFKGVERCHKVGLFMNEKGAPKWVTQYTVIFEFTSFLKKEPNVVTERTRRCNGDTWVGERVQPENLGPSLSLLTRFDQRERHGGSSLFWKKISALITALWVVITLTCCFHAQNAAQLGDRLQTDI